VFFFSFFVANSHPYPYSRNILFLLELRGAQLGKLGTISKWSFRVAVTGAVCTALWFAGSAALTTGTADKRQNIEMEIQQLKKQNAALSASNSRLAQRIQALRTDERVIEQIAREELGMIRGDETIFLFPPEFDDQYASAQ